MGGIMAMGITVMMGIIMAGWEPPPSCQLWVPRSAHPPWTSLKFQLATNNRQILQTTGDHTQIKNSDFH